MQKRRPRSKRKAKGKPKKAVKAAGHKFGQWKIPAGTRVVGFANWSPTDQVDGKDLIE
jgi:hypothetical protein